MDATRPGDAGTPTTSDAALPGFDAPSGCGFAPPGVVEFAGGFATPEVAARHALDLTTAPRIDAPEAARACASAWIRPVLLRVRPPSGAAFHVVTSDDTGWYVTALDGCDGSLLACGDAGRVSVPERADARPVVLVVGPAWVRGAGVGRLGAGSVELRAGPALGPGALCRDARSTLGVCAQGLSCHESGVCVPTGAGRACPVSEPCGEHLRCVEGVCRPVFPADERCATAGALCEGGQVCASAGLDVTRCAPPLPEGADCWSQTLSPPCAEGRACTWAGCAAPLPRGAPCTDFGGPSSCERGLHCIDSVCALAGVEGGVCGRSGALCFAGLACDEAGRCVQPDAALGERCDPTAGVRCGRPNECYEGVCRTSGRGAFCLDASHCPDGWRCPDRVCVPPATLERVCGTPGASCRGDEVCEQGVCRAPGRCPDGCPEGALCVAGQCVPPGARAGRCRSWGEGSLCDPGLACDDALRCVPALEEGARCGAPDRACGEGLRCVDNACVRSGREGAWCGARGGRFVCDAGLGCDRGVRCERLDQGVNATCSLTLPGACAAGLSCAAGVRNYCVPIGSINGRCRGSAPRCDEGLVCGRDPSSGERCYDPIPLGEPCLLTSDLCAEGSTCTNLLRGPATRCTKALAGTENARCRAASPRCDAPLFCEPDLNYCRPPLAQGAFCDARRPCVEGLSCHRGICQRLGAEGDFCRDDAPRCDAGLACLGLRCVRVPEGQPCARGQDCGEGNLCVLGRCRVMGAAEGDRCGLRATPCPPGFFCDTGWGGTWFTCARELPEGAVCDSPRCGATRDCIVGRCVSRGSLGGQCRHNGTTLCDGDLQCLGDRCSAAAP